MFARDLERVALRLLKALDIAEAKVVSDHIKHRRWDQLVKTKFDPTLHQSRSIDDMRRICLAQEFLRKADFLESGIDKAQVARDAFLVSERSCKAANDHLDRFLENPVLETDLQIAYFEALARARSWVKNTLGPLPDYLDGSFGPGAVFESKSWPHRNLTAYDKLRNMPAASQNMPKSLQWHLVGETAVRFAWADGRPLDGVLTVRGNRFTTVPKDSTKDRGIAIEPGLNVFGQLAVGKAIRRRLLRRNIDLRGDFDLGNLVVTSQQLRSQLRMGQDLHRRLAKEASVTGLSSTIDLSNASDTICHKLVKLLLPEEWYNLLSSLRSEWTLFSPNGKKAYWYKLEKFSSMGNGFTFELETLIFCALLHSMGCKIGTDTFVYGDDMIVPSSRMADVLAILKYSGFTPNLTKTFGSEIRFKESCGGDFFNGHDIRPFYIKELPDAPEDWIALANRLWYWSIKWSMPELMAVRASVLDLIPEGIRRCRGPQELGDLVIHECDPRDWSAVVRGSVRYIRVWRPVVRKNYLFRRYDSDLSDKRKVLSEDGVALAAALMGLPSSGIAPRNSVAGYRFGRVKYS